MLISKKGKEVGETCDNWTIIWIETIRGKIERLADRVEKTKISTVLDMLDVLSDNKRSVIGQVQDKFAEGADGRGNAWKINTTRVNFEEKRKVW